MIVSVHVLNMVVIMVAIMMDIIGVKNVDWLDMLYDVMHDLMNNWLMVDSLVVDDRLLMGRMMDWLMDYSMMDWIVNDRSMDWLVMGSSHNVLVMRHLVMSLGHFRVGMDGMSSIMSTFGSIKVSRCVWVDIVIGGVVHRVVRCLVVHNICSNNLVVANLLMGGQNIVVHGSMLDRCMMDRLVIKMAGHVPCV